MTHDELRELIARAIGAKIDASFESWKERWTFEGGILDDAPKVPSRLSEISGHELADAILSALTTAGLAIVPVEVEMLAALDKGAYAALHNYQHSGVVHLVKPRPGSSIIAWAAQELAALRAILTAKAKQ